MIQVLVRAMALGLRRVSEALLGRLNPKLPLEPRAPAGGPPQDWLEKVRKGAPHLLLPGPAVRPPAPSRLSDGPVPQEAELFRKAPEEDPGHHDPLRRLPDRPSFSLESPAPASPAQGVSSGPPFERGTAGIRLRLWSGTPPRMPAPRPPSEEQLDDPPLSAISPGDPGMDSAPSDRLPHSSGVEAIEAPETLRPRMRPAIPEIPLPPSLSKALSRPKTFPGPKEGRRSVESPREEIERFGSGVRIVEATEATRSDGSLLESGSWAELPLEGPSRNPEGVAALWLPAPSPSGDEAPPEPSTTRAPVHLWPELPGPQTPEVQDEWESFESERLHEEKLRREQEGAAWNA